MKWMIITYISDDSTSPLFSVDSGDKYKQPILRMIIIHLSDDLSNHAFASTYAHFNELLSILQRLGRKRLSG